MSSAQQGWIGVDLDGTLAFYDGWHGSTHVGKPIPAMVERVKDWLAAGILVKIFTARVSTMDIEERAVIVDAIKQWCREHIGQNLEITCVKDYAMLELYDDRAVQVVPNTGELVGGSTRGFT